MQSKGFIQNNAIFASHSLGEYSALASVTGVLPISSLVDFVFYRGIMDGRQRQLLIRAMFDNIRDDCFRPLHTSTRL